MAERLHYFAEASTPVSFDCEDSEIDSDLEADLSRRPASDVDRAKIHARQLQLWSDEARRRRSGNLPPPQLSSPHRRPSSSSDVFPHATPARPKPSIDRQASNLSERARSVRVPRSHSAKNLRIRVTPSSSSKSLVSDIESEVGQPASIPQSPHVAPLGEGRPAAASGGPMVVKRVDSAPLTAPLETQGEPNDGSNQNTIVSPFLLTSPNNDVRTNSTNEQQQMPAEERPRSVRRISFSRRVKPFTTIKRWLKR